MVMPKKPKNQLAKSPKRGHVGVDPSYHSRLMMLVKHYQQEDSKFSANKLVCRWVEEEEAKVRAAQAGS